MVREGLDHVFCDRALCCFAFPVPGSGEQGVRGGQEHFIPGEHRFGGGWRGCRMGDSGPVRTARDAAVIT